jgi:signal transduction histidine kinase
MHGGTVRLESVPGQGTRAIVTLPLEQGKAVPGEAKAPLAVAGA